MFLDALHDIKEYSAVCSVDENVLDEEGKDEKSDKSAEEIKQEKKKAKKEKKEKEKEDKKKEEEEEEEKEEEKEKKGEKEKEAEKEKEEEEANENKESQEEKGSKASPKEGNKKQRKDKIIKIRDGGLGGGIGAEAGGGEKKKKEKKEDSTSTFDTTSTPTSSRNLIEESVLPVTTSSLPSNKHTSAHTNTQADSTSQRKLNTNSRIRKYGALNTVVRTCDTHQSTHSNSRVRTLSDTTASSPVRTYYYNTAFNYSYLDC